MSGLLRRFRPSSDATPRAGEGTPDENATPAAPDAAATAAPDEPALAATPAEPQDTAAFAAPAEPESAPAEPESAPAEPESAPAEPEGSEAAPDVPAPAAVTMTSGDPLAARAATPAAAPEGGISGDPLAARPAAAPEGATQVMPAAALEPETPRLPAGVAPEEMLGDRPDTRKRGRLRRRLRHLRRLRELMLRDIGGLAFEIYRSGDPAATEHGRVLVQGKLDALALLDAERRELEAILGRTASETVLREPGIGGTCPTCTEYFASDARFCSRCGTRVDGRSDPAAPAPDAVAPAPEGAALWAGDRPAALGAPDPTPAEAVTEVPAGEATAAEPIGAETPEGAAAEPAATETPADESAVVATAEPVADAPADGTTELKEAATEPVADAPAEPATVEAPSLEKRP